jgi:FtsP/CotA-like multicopper oxidase with cupredoxin domain
MYEPRPKELSRRQVLGGVAGALTIAAGGAVGYAVARMDGEDRGRPRKARFGMVKKKRAPPVQPSPLTLTYHAKPQTVEIGAGVQYNAWTFDGTSPGPILHVKQGDTIDFTLVNDAQEGHSIDFHAARTPWDKNYVTIVPGDSINFTWTADFPGVFVYHCGTPPVLHHIANGLYGAVVVDPETPFEPATEYVLVQSEFYAKSGANGTWDADMDKMLAARPDILAFNGAAFQYRDNPLPAKVGEDQALRHERRADFLLGISWSSEPYLTWCT